MSLLVPRSTWGSSFDYDARHAARPADPDKVEAVLHHSVTLAPDLDVTDLADEFEAMRTLERIGTARFRSGVSYNAAVMPSGNAYAGQPLDTKATHSEFEDWNFSRASIVFVGNYQLRHPTPAQIATCARILARWKLRGTIKRLEPRLHREVKHTSCPGEHVADRAVLILAAAREHLAQLAGTYRVRDGDTIESVAERFDLPVAKLWRLNRPRLETGEELKVR